MEHRLSLLRQRYERLKPLLEQMSHLTALLDAGTLKSTVAAAQQVFRNDVLSTQLDALAPTLRHWVQSYEVEIDKQLRLLGVDLMFLQAARQLDTTEQRWQQVRDRLETLQQYYDAVLEKEKAEDEGLRGRGGE